MAHPVTCTFADFHDGVAVYTSSVWADLPCEVEVCSYCGLEWDRHPAGLDGKIDPTPGDCLDALTDELREVGIDYRYLEKFVESSHAEYRRQIDGLYQQLDEAQETIAFLRSRWRVPPSSHVRTSHG